MLPVTPHLWFDDQKAKEAAWFYTSLMPDSAITTVNHFEAPFGVCELVEFTFAGQPFMGIGAAKPQQVSPAISFMIHFDPSRDADAAARIDGVWNKLADGGKVMMPIDRYPFSDRYGWVADKYGISWQLMLTKPEGDERPVIVPSLMYTGEVAGRAEEAIDFYCSIFKDGKRGITARYPQGMAPDKEGSLMYADFYVDAIWMAAMDSAHPHGFTFNDAVSLLIPCENQQEIDHYWTALTADGGQPGQCGWLKDKFGVSWQVATTVVTDTIKNGTREQINRVMGAFMQMTKIDIAALEEARDKA